VSVKSVFPVLLKKYTPKYFTLFAQGIVELFILIFKLGFRITAAKRHELTCKRIELNVPVTTKMFADTD